MSLLADFYSYETDFIQGLLKKIEKKLVWSFDVTFYYIDDVFSLINCKLYDKRDGFNFPIVNFHLHVAIVLYVLLRFTPAFWLGSCWSIFSFLCSVL